MDKNLFIKKLKAFGIYYSFLSDNPLFIDSLISMVCSSVEIYDENNFNKALLTLKKLIKKEINNQYAFDREKLFKRLFSNYLSKRFISNESKIKLLSSVISAISTPIEREFFEDFTSNWRKFDCFFTDFYIKDQNGVLGVNYELLSKYPYLETIVEEYVKNKIKSKGIIKNQQPTNKSVMNDSLVFEYYDRIRQGDFDALHEFVMKNMNLMNSVVNRYASAGFCFEDLRSVGYLALVDAAMNYNPNRGFTFATYSFSKINDRIRRYVNGNIHIVHFPFYKIEKIFALEFAINNEQIRLGRSLSDNEIIDLFSLSSEQFSDYRIFRESTLNIDEFDCDYDYESEYPLGMVDEKIENIFQNIEVEEILDCARNCLTPSEFGIFLMRFGAYGKIYSHSVIGRVFNLSRERIRQIECNIREILMGQEVIYKYIDDSKKTDFEKRLEEVCEGDFEVLSYIRYRLGLNSNRALSHHALRNKMKNSKHDVEYLRNHALLLLSKNDDMEFVCDRIDTIAKTKARKKNLNIINMLRTKYSMDEISIILSSLSDEDLECLKVRYGEDFSTLLPCDTDTIVESRNIIKKKIPFVAKFNGINGKNK